MLRARSTAGATAVLEHIEALRYFLGTRILAGMSISKYDVNDWAEAIANLHASTAHDPGDMRTAYDAVAMLWSGYGYQDAPTEVIKMLVNAIEIGYMVALNDIRRGRLDNEIGRWRKWGSGGWSR